MTDPLTQLEDDFEREQRLAEQQEADGLTEAERRHNASEDKVDKQDD